MNSALKKTTRNDWHPADIKCAMAKAGWSFARIAREYGYTAPNGPNVVLRKPWSVMEQIVADVIGVHPSDIWPSRYDERRRPLRCGPKSFHRLRTKTEDSRAESD